MRERSKPERTFYRTLGAAIRRHREARDLSQSALARRIKEKPNAVNRWESGRYRPTAYDLVRLAGELGVTGAELLAEVE